MAKREFSDEDRAAAYEYARRKIAEAKAAGVTNLDLDPDLHDGKTATLSVIPPEIADLGELTHLDLQGTQVADLTPLQAMTGLQRLYLHDTQVADLAPLQALTGLQALTLVNTQVADLAPLQAMTGLQELILDNTQVADLTPLRAMTGLQTLGLSDTEIADLAPLQAMTGLQKLWLGSTQVADLAPLQAMTGLQTLWLNNTQVADLAPLQALTGLQTLNLNNTQIADLAPLLVMNGLRELRLNRTQVADLAPLQAMTGLQVLTLDGTQVADLAPLQAMTGLLELSLVNTQVADLLPLAGLSKLGEGVLDGLWFRDTPAADRDDAHRALAAIEDGEDCAKQMLQYLNGEHPKFGGPPEPFVQPRRQLLEPLPDLDTVFQDQGGMQFQLSASLSTFSVLTASAHAPASARQLLPRLRTRVAQALAVYDGAADDPAALILADLQEVDRIVACAIHDIADQALALWELSVGLASYLDEDAAAVKAMVNYPTLGDQRRGVLSRLINSSAIFVRMFPDALALDESHKDFLLNASRGCLPSQITELAQLYTLLEARSVDLIKAVEEIAKRSSAQAEKAEAVSTKGSRNLIAVVVAFAMGAVGNGFFGDLGADLSEEMKLCLRSAYFLRDSQDEVRSFCADAPEDFRQAVEAAIEAVTGQDLPPMPPIKPVEG